MKISIKFFPVIILILLFLACDHVEKEKKSSEGNNEKIALVKDLHEIKVDIKGMTCEIGCARLIQSKLYKTEGISFAKVSFEDSSGVVRFDKNRVSEEDIRKVIEQTAGGDIYAVAGMTEMELSDTDLN